MTPALPVDFAAAVRVLAAADPVLAGVIERVGPCDIAPEGKVDVFAALLRSITYQQLHGRAAETIHGRVLALMPRKTAKPAAFLAVSDELLRGAGLSRNKLLAARDLAAKCLDGSIPTAKEIVQLSDDEILARLTPVRGIGVWTVQMLLIFYLGRPDVLPIGDFAIRKAFSQLYRRGRAVKPESIQRHARRWQPYRSIASWYLWRSLDADQPVHLPD